MSQRFDTVLVANRGEIACRVLRTARAEGYRTVAVFSDADASAPHAGMADQAVRLGPGPAGQSYLNIERVIEAAKVSGVQAIHPGYGFLSENRAFAEACAQAGLVFIGPPAAVIHALGNKAEAKRLVKKSGVPCVPGYEDRAQDDATLRREAKAIGFPVLLKAAAGGGGRGMRRVHREAEFDEALRGARSEAKNAFGSDELIIERLIEHARHVEIQVLADEHGTVLHLGERDCSVQRRHQKIIEESPCPVMTPGLRAAMGAAAVSAARAAGYVNAGTVEFLLDDGGKFYFLEVNTRLQVEHPVTELVTGLDLVALQLRIAQGERLALAQEDVKFAGHAIEARLYAEDPAAGFAPQAGTIQTWRPASGTGIRIDHGLCDGLYVSPYYDPMLAKVIAFGATRAEALHRLDGALRDSVVLGLRTNADLLRRIVRNADFAAGEARTDFIEVSGVLDGEVPAPGAKELLIAGAAFIEREAARVPALLKGWRSTGPATIPLRLLWNETAHALRISMSGNRYSLELDGAAPEIEVTAFDGRTVWFRDGSRRETAPVAFDGDRLHVRFGERNDLFVDATYAPPAEKAAAGDGVLKAPMVGQVVRVNAAPGTAVAKGAVLIVIEAMKMENQVVAPYDGEVESVSVSVGDHVDANQVLMKLGARGQEQL
jgi:geranyl-CoA carboxylase alpha subunit